MNKKICITVEDRTLTKIAKKQSQQLHLPIVKGTKNYDLLISFSSLGIYIKDLTKKIQFYVD